MKAKYLELFLAAAAVAACGKDPLDLSDPKSYYGTDIPHDEIILGERLENPYRTETIQAAYSSLYPTKARTDIHTNMWYVRILPKDDSEFRMLESLGIVMIDHPLDYGIVREGDWYHDPEIASESITWQYAVVPKDYEFPEGITYEKIHDCYIASEDTKASPDIDWDAVEKEAYRMTGNGSMIVETKAGSGASVHPSGRITVIDPKYCGGKPCGVSGVAVVVNSFVKFSVAHTDREGYYEIPKSYSSDIRYRLMFKNEKGFAIGVNLILVPASVSTLGKASPEGVSLTVTEKSEDKLYHRCVVNNAAYDYYERCTPDDLNITAPASDIRIWIFHKLESSSAVMLHQGAVVSLGTISEFLGQYAFLVKFFAPDITIGAKNKDSFEELYTVTQHEFAHASHFAEVGTSFWNPYIRYILESFIMSGGTTYGTADSENSGYCDVGETWAYYLQGKLRNDRYGGAYKSFGTSYWFYPQLFRNLEERGFSAGDIFASLEEDIVSRKLLQDRMLSLYPSRQRVINQVFDKYK